MNRATHSTVTTGTPDPSPSQSQTYRRMDMPEDVLARLFVGDWAPIHASPLYVASLVVIACLIILLPLAYFALIGAVGFGVYWSITENIFVARGTTPGPLLGPVLGTLAAFVGTILFIAMVKPVIAPIRKREDEFTLYRENEPRLYAFVEALCAIIGAPTPKRIDVTGEVNASASFRRGLLSLIMPGDFVLTIGMPLAAGMTVAEFAGVLAHELGHFSQRAGMRASYIINTVQFWLVRAVYEPDGWDAMLDRWAHRAGGPALLLLLAVSITLLLSKAVLWVLLLLSSILTSFLSRQMEFNADRYQLRLVGPKVFARTHARMTELHAGLFYGMEEAMVMHHRTRKRELPDDMAALAVDHAGRVTKEALQRVEIHRKATERGLFLSHPPTHIRIDRATRLGEPGIMRAEMPASTLFADFADGCRTATFGLYKETMGEDFYEAKFVPTSKLTGARAQEGVRRQRLIKFLGFDPPTWRPLFPITSGLPERADPRRAVERIKEAKAIIRQTASDAAAATEKFRDSSEQLLRIQQARAVIEAKLKVDYKLLNMLPTSLAAMSVKSELLQTEIASSADTLESALEAGQSRLAAALSLLSAPGIAERLSDVSGKRARAGTLLSLLEGLRLCLQDIRELRVEMAQADAITRSINSDKELETAKATLRPLSDRVRDRLLSIRERAGGVVYPYENLDRSRNLGERLIGATLGWREFDQIFSAGARTVEIYAEDQRRAIAELVEIAATIEQELARSVEASTPQ